MVWWWWWYREWIVPDAGVDFKLWNEQPENYPTCLATRPYPKAVAVSIHTTTIKPALTRLF